MNIKEIFDGLKDRLKKNQSNYVETNDWNGDTEMGFYTTEDFDFDKLMLEIDDFIAEFEAAAEENKS